MLDQNQVLECIASALEVDGELINENTKMHDLEEWDSFGHLNVLMALDAKVVGKAASISSLSGAFSVKEIISVLRKHDLVS